MIQSWALHRSTAFLSHVSERQSDLYYSNISSCIPYFISRKSVAVQVFSDSLWFLNKYFFIFFIFQNGVGTLSRFFITLHGFVSWYRNYVLLRTPDQQFCQFYCYFSYTISCSVSLLQFPLIFSFQGQGILVLAT